MAKDDELYERGMVAFTRARQVYADMDKEHAP
jgi:hypothetical protein